MRTGGSIAAEPNPERRRREIIGRLVPRALAPLPALLLLLLLALPARGAYTWCKTDPVVALDGALVSIYIAVPDAAVPRVSGATHVQVATPEGIDRRVVMTDPGFNGHGERVSFADLRGRGWRGWARGADAGYWIRVRVRLPVEGDAPVPVQLTVDPEHAPPTVAYGESTSTATWVWMPPQGGEE